MENQTTDRRYLATNEFFTNIITICDDTFLKITKVSLPFFKRMNQFSGDGMLVRAFLNR